MLQQQLSLKGRALRYLATREYSRVELEKKLKQYEQVAGELAAVLDELECKGLICQTRVIESTLHQKAHRFGAAKVLYQLKSKGIDSDKIEAVAASLKETEFDRAMLLWQRRFGTVYQNPSEYAKQARFLTSRGFGGEVVRRVMRASRQSSE